MAFDRMRRAVVALASGVVLLALGACGSGSIESQFIPTRVVSFGDAMSDAGQTGKKYTVNAASTRVWPEIVALNYGLALTPAASGGRAYGTANARIVNKPDAAGNAATPTVKEQVDTFLAGGAPTANDLILLQGGYSDIIFEMAKVTAGTQSGGDMLNNVAQAARDMAAQARRLVTAGARHVVVTGVYTLGRSPWAVSIGQQNLLTQASARFNESLLIALVDDGNNVLYVDTALQYDAMSTSPQFFGLTNVADPVCTSVDPGPGIGIGANQINSGLCTETTIVAGQNYATYLYADRVYVTPLAHRLLGESAFSRIRNRW